MIVNDTVEEWLITIWGDGASPLRCQFFSFLLLHDAFGGMPGFIGLVTLEVSRRGYRLTYTVELVAGRSANCVAELKVRAGGPPGASASSRRGSIFF
jgi:hypothetical protein